MAVVPAAITQLIDTTNTQLATQTQSGDDDFTWLYQDSGYTMAANELVKYFAIEDQATRANLIYEALNPLSKQALMSFTSFLLGDAANIMGR